MVDWADEKADKLMDALWDRDSNIQAGLAEAFRQFRNETLEEAAKVVLDHANTRGKSLTNYAQLMAAAIRALKGSA